ncbi:MAG: hypothetical protein JNL81_06315 [Hyphomonadaceae bacterium]|nr:hypothetical protein [Hyphomonadaceae bacterium]
MTEPVTYFRRGSAISRSEREWRVEADALVTRGSSGREKRYRWADIVSVRLLHDPVRARDWRYIFELQPKHARKIVIDNAHYIGARDFEERSETYTPFVRAAIARWADTHPHGRVLIGETPKRYFFLLIGALIFLCLVAYFLVAVRTPLDATPYANLVKFGVILLMLPIFWRSVLKIVPRGVAPDQIPDRAFPPNSNSG